MGQYFFSFCKASFPLPFPFSNIEYAMESPLSCMAHPCWQRYLRARETEKLEEGVKIAMHKPWLEVEPPFKRFDIFQFTFKMALVFGNISWVLPILCKSNNYQLHRRCKPDKWRIRLLLKDENFTGVLWKRTALDGAHLHCNQKDFGDFQQVNICPQKSKSK